MIFFRKIVIQGEVSRDVSENDIPLVNDILNIARDEGMSVRFEKNSILIKNVSYFDDFESIIEEIMDRLKQFDYFNRVSYENSPSVDARLIPVKLAVIWRED